MIVRACAGWRFEGAGGAIKGVLAAPPAEMTGRTNGTVRIGSQCFNCGLAVGKLRTGRWVERIAITAEQGQSANHAAEPRAHKSAAKPHPALIQQTGDSVSLTSAILRGYRENIPVTVFP